MAAPIPELRTAEKPPLYRDVRTIRLVGQLVVVAIVLLFLFTLYSNAIDNLAARNLPTGFDFLGFQFRSAIPGLDGAAEYSILRAFGAGYLNTVRVILFGIPAATALGILIGIARLSENAAVRAVGTLYVETFRNIPPLLWIFFITTVFLIENIPQIDQRVTPLGISVFSNRGIGVPWFNPSSSVATFVAFAGLGLLAAVLVAAWRGRVNARTGEPARGGLYGLVAFLVLVGIGHVLSGSALALDVPMLVEQDNGVLRIDGGISMAPAYAGLTAALTLYTASHIAEIVRGAIQAIAKGQTEAANAVALNTYQRYRFVILPQAFRIAIPPLASQYLNITKNSSLGVAVGYIELTAIFQRISNNATPALQALIILMVFYLTFSLGISVIANIINRRLALEDR